MFNIIFYEQANGSIPVLEYLEQLEPKARTKVIGFLELLSEYGIELREPYSKALSSGIFELRCRYRSTQTRILYFFYSGKDIIVTNGFTKNTKRTPRQELALVKQRKADYKERRQTGHDFRGI